MPNPSVALCSANPITSSSASESPPPLAAWPIASPSEKLCSPMPVAMDIPSCSAPRASGTASLMAMAPGP